MRMPKQGEKGFTLIEVLIVVAILGVLAAVIIPNISRFFGSGKEEAQETEKSNVQLAVDAMMMSNSLSTLPSNAYTVAGGVATNNMALFPDNSVCGSADKLNDPNGTAYNTINDVDGYILFGMDETGGNVAGPYVNYMRESTTKYFYAIGDDGTVHQYADAAMTGGELSI